MCACKKTKAKKTKEEREGQRDQGQGRTAEANVFAGRARMAASRGGAAKAKSLCLTQRDWPDQNSPFPAILCC